MEQWAQIYFVWCKAVIDKDGFRPNVGIILANSHGQVLWAKRLGWDAWQFPQGGIDSHETPEDALFRELKEETGLVAAKYKELMRLHLSNSVSDELAIIYLATELIQEDAAPEETEALQIKKVSLSDAFGMVADGTITDAMSVAALTKIELLQVQGLLI